MPKMLLRLLQFSTCNWYLDTEETPFHIACKVRHFDVVEQFKGINLNAQHLNGITSICDVEGWSRPNLGKIDL